MKRRCWVSILFALIIFMGTVGVSEAKIQKHVDDFDKSYFYFIDVAEPGSLNTKVVTFARIEGENFLRFYSAADSIQSIQIDPTLEIKTELPDGTMKISTLVDDKNSLTSKVDRESFASRIWVISDDFLKEIVAAKKITLRLNSNFVFNIPDKSFQEMKTLFCDPAYK